jgi:hypothetical protein
MINMFSSFATQLGLLKLPDPVTAIGFRIVGCCDTAGTHRPPRRRPGEWAGINATRSRR